MPIFMKFDGIEGQVTAAGHEKWIELDSCQLGVNRHIAVSGHGGNREAGAPSVSEIVVTKSQDKASTGLFQASLFGHGKKVLIDFCKTSGDGKSQQKYLELTLENTLVSSYNVSGHGGSGHDRPMESLSLSFTKIEWSYLESDDKNKVGTPAKASWDLVAGKA